MTPLPFADVAARWGASDLDLREHPVFSPSFVFLLPLGHLLGRP